MECMQPCLSAQASHACGRPQSLQQHCRLNSDSMADAINVYRALHRTPLVHLCCGLCSSRWGMSTVVIA